ncbi:alpha/beta hydrolase family protein [Paludisphaera rhizosphaerae]|uniref:alpha/beta hydrolase family protein n=1 Tax=Paludisphaera rhizosphaerae TaxID=2711216 RepID=UPI001F0E4919|nr:dienelactone hydrolase family protein [Paludisphaera rhizosphaerae]
MPGIRTLLAFALGCAASIALGSFPVPATANEPLPNTQALTEEGDLAAKMVAGIHRYLDRELAASVENRKAMWKVDASSVEAYRRSVEPNRARLRKYLGVVDPRLPASVEYVGGPDQPALVAEAAEYRVYAIRWAVLPGVDGEGLLLEPKGKAVANVVALPDADWTPEMAVGLAPGVAPSAQFPRRLAENGVRVIVPTLIDRKDDFSANPRLNRATNQPHREFIHRMAFEMGRTLLGYEVQEVLAAVDWFCRDEGHPRTGVIGYGEGGLIAFYAAALDERIDAGLISGSFGPREQIAEEPIYHDVWGLLTEFGDGDVLRLIAPRSMVFAAAPFTAPAGPPARSGRSGAAPGRSQAASPEAAKNEAATVLHELAGAGDAALRGVRFPVEASAGADEPVSEAASASFFQMLGIPAKPAAPGAPPVDSRKSFDPVPRQKRLFDQLVGFTQKLWRDSETTRKAFWARADAPSPASWEKSCEWYRDYFHTEVIGKLPEPTMPPNPRTRQVYDQATWTGHEVMIDVYPDVFASGVLLLPKDLKPGEKRPVIVTQHGLEGTPRHTIDAEKKPVYDEFSRKLVEQGYIVYAPQNPYYGDTVFRQLQRKGHPLKLAIFSFVIRQHQRTLDWLETLPNVDPGRIAFYGLSYGGKTAVRVPAVEKRYCLSICSGDFNEWIGKNVSVDLDRSYMWTREYDMGEFDMGNTFNYAEMVNLIAPRPFMVERGHDDGVGTDEMISYEYAKVRYLYANRLKIPDRTEIEYQPGGHRIYGKGTFDFLRRHLGWTSK